MTKEKIHVITVWILIALFCVAAPALVWAQSATTSLKGVVLDSSGAVIPGTVIALDNNATGFHSQTSADAKGQYEFPQLAPGTYSITATSAGMGKQTKVAELLVDQPATISFTLSVQAAVTTVNVSAEAQTLNTSDATIGNSVSNSTIQALPMEGRNVPDLLSLQPGVLYLGRQIDQTVDSRSGAVSGARSDQTNVTLDGVDDNDQTNGFAFTGVLRSTIDSVEEFRVTTTQANADTGRTSGAQVVLVTKSGTNQFHGSAYEYNRNTLFAANDWFNKQAELAAGLPDKPGSLLRNTFGATFGGPIKKDKLFFFLNYEGQRTSENQQETQTVPTASLRAGNVVYCPATVTNCNAGNAITLTPAEIANMDPGCTACTYGPGVDPNTLAVFNKYPLPNGTVLGDGLNTASFTWSAPNPTSLNTFITKLDYSAGSHSLFVRGNLQADTQSGPPQFPGDPPSYALKTNSKDHPTVPPLRRDAPAEPLRRESDLVTLVPPAPRPPVPAPPTVVKPASQRSSSGAAFGLLSVVAVIVLAVCAAGVYLSFLSPTPPNTGLPKTAPPMATTNPAPAPAHSPLDKDIPARPPPPVPLVGARPLTLDCTREKGVSAVDMRKAQEWWAKYLGRKVEEEDEIAPGVKMKFVLVPPGKFLMGSPEGEVERNKDEVLHEVELTLPFYLGVYDVTQAQYEAVAVTDKTPSNFKGADLPVETVSWEDADAFAKGLTQKARDGLLYRLPTEAEWEYSCRGGRPSSLPFGIGDGSSLSSHDANFDGDHPYGGAEKGPHLQTTTPVGTYKANALGLYDMHGNVYQWCSDWYVDYPGGKVSDPSGSSRVTRGGSWYYFAGDCRAAHRGWSRPGFRLNGLGFRLARVPSGLSK